jgi:hypothetical protein
MIKGTYKVYQEGKLIGEYENKLTETGRILALKTLMGAIPSFAGSLSVGIDGTANTISGSFATNKRLGFKVCSSPVFSSNVGLSGSTDALVFKARIDDPSAYKIWELGLFSDPLPGGATTNRMENILNFEGSDNLMETDGSALLTATAELIDSSNVTYGSLFRNGDTALLVKSTKTVKSNNSFSGLETFTNTDLLNVAYYADANADLTIVFYSNLATMTYATPFAYTGSAAYRIINTPISSGVSGGTGTFDWSNVTEIRFSAANGNILLDGVRFENADITDTNNGLVSRTALGSAITKVSGIPIDIEYYLRVDFNG